MCKKNEFESVLSLVAYYQMVRWQNTSYLSLFEISLKM